MSAQWAADQFTDALLETIEAEGLWNARPLHEVTPVIHGEGLIVGTTHGTFVVRVERIEP